MNDQVASNLAWLCMTMTMPLDSEDKAYYDKDTRTFFYYSDTDIFFTDELIRDVTGGFDEEVHSFLVDRHERIANFTWDILRIPQHRFNIDPLSDSLAVRLVIQKAVEYAAKESISLSISKILMIDVNDTYGRTIKRWEERINQPWWRFW